MISTSKGESVSPSIAPGTPKAATGNPSSEIPEQDQTNSPGLAQAALSAAALLALSACGGGGESSSITTVAALDLPGSGGLQPAVPGANEHPDSVDAARFLTQATFGIQSIQQIEQTRQKGFALWLWEQFNTGYNLHTSYLDQQKQRNVNSKGIARATDEMSYEAIWQQWLFDNGQLRARIAFAWSEIMVISNVAPDLRPYAMSSYMDMLNRNAFGNYRELLKSVTLHPTMGYYLNMINSERDDPKTGAHPNENYAREVLQLFSIGLVKLNLDGTSQRDGQGNALPTYDESVVKGFAKAFTGWSYPNASRFDKADESAPEAWTSPMKPFPEQHSPEEKTLLDGTILPGGQSPEKDLDAAIDNIFHHPNVGPFICRQLIQRLVTSNPSPAYIARVASVFNDNGGGVRGDLRAVISAILLDSEARNPTDNNYYGKQREPVIRFANFLRGLGAKSANGINSIHYLDKSDNGLGQSPLLAPSVFNFFSPNFRPSGPIAQAGLVAPEFQITTETTVVGGLNFFSNLFYSGSFGGGESKLILNYAPLEALSANPDALITELNALFFNYGMSITLQNRMRTMLNALSKNSARSRVKYALVLSSLSPEFIIQK